MIIPAERKKYMTICYIYITIIVTRTSTVRAGFKRGIVLDDAGNHKFARGSRPVPF